MCFIFRTWNLKILTLYMLIHVCKTWAAKHYHLVFLFNLLLYLILLLLYLVLFRTRGRGGSKVKSAVALAWSTDLSGKTPFQLLTYLLDNIMFISIFIHLFHLLLLKLTIHIYTRYQFFILSVNQKSWNKAKQSYDINHLISNQSKKS